MTLTDEQRDGIAERVAARVKRLREEAAADAPTSARAAEIARARAERQTGPTYRAPARKRRRAPQAHGRPHTDTSRARISAAQFARAWAGVDLTALPPLRRARVEAGYSLRNAAYECGVSITAFTNAEAGRPVTPETRRRISSVFGPEVFTEPKGTPAAPAS